MAKQVLNKQQRNYSNTYIAYDKNATQNTYSASTDRLTVTMTSAPAGDYAIYAHIGINPSGSGNATVDITTNSGGTLSYQAGGVHSADADYSTTKYMHRYLFGMIQNHAGGTFTVTVRLNVESASNFVVGNSADGRWQTSLMVVKVA